MAPVRRSSAPTTSPGPSAANPPAASTGASTVSSAGDPSTALPTKGNGRGRPPSSPLSPSSPSSSRGLTAARRAYLVAKYRAAESVLYRREQFAAKWGQSFRDTTGTYLRKLFDVLGYNQTLTTEDYWARFERDGIAARIVKAYPRATWVSGVEVVESGDRSTEESTTFEAAVRELVKRLKLWTRLQRADLISGLGEYSILVIGAEGDLSTELPRLSTPDPSKIVQLTPRAERSARILEDKIDNDPSSPRFGLPTLYRVKLDKINETDVHWSRVIHVADNCLEGDLYGEPVLRSVWNRLDDLDKNVGGGSEAAWRRMDPGVNWDLDPEAELDPEEIEDIEDEIEEYRHEGKRDILTMGVTPTPLNAAVVNFGPNGDFVLRLIAGSKGFPVRILTGSERGELASSQDETNFGHRVDERRTDFAAPVVHDFFDRLIEFGYLPKPSSPAGYELSWPEGEGATESEKADTADKIASANQKQSLAGQPPVMTSQQIAERVFEIAPEEFQPEPVEPAEPAPTDVGGLRSSADTTDADADEPEWGIIHRVADDYTDQTAEAVGSMWRSAAQTIDLPALEAQLGVANVEGSTALVEAALTLAEGESIEPLSSLLLEIEDAAGLDITRAANDRGSWLRSARRTPTASTASTVSALQPFSADFSSADPRAVAWAESRAAALLSDTSPATREAVRALIRKGIDEGIPPAKLARQIRDFIGLLPDHLTAVETFRDQILSADPGDLVTAGTKGSTQVTVRIPRSGPTEALADLKSQRYAERLIDYRALMTARSETMRASNEGVRGAWRQAVDAGSLPADIQRVWIVTPDDRLRDKHRAMAGQVTGIDEPFDPPIEPGQEVHCRCGQGIATAEDVEADRARRTAA